MATIQSRIESRIGESVSGDLGLTAVMLQDAYNSGLKAVISPMPAEAWKFFGKSEISFNPSTGTPLTLNKIISVTRRDGSIWRKCVEIEQDMFGPALDINSIHYRTSFTPAYAIDSGTYSNPMLKVAPAGAGDAARVILVGIPSVDITTDTIIPHFPDDLEELPEIYTVIWVKEREMGLARRDSQTELEAITSAGYLTDFEGALPTFSTPVAPNMPSLSLFDMTALPTLTLTAAPTFSGMTLPTPPASTLAYVTAGAAPSSTVTVGTSLPAYSAPVAPGYDSTIIDAALLNATNIISNSGIKATTDVETLLSTNLIDAARTGVETARAEINLAQASIQDQVSQLQDFAEEVKQALGQFNGETAVYNADAQQTSAEVQAGIQSYVAKLNDNRADLEEQIAQYTGDIQVYAAEAQATVSEWQVEEVSYKLGLWTAQVRSETAEYVALVNAYIGEYSAKNTALIAEYNTSVNAVIGEYQALVQGEVAEFQSGMNKATSYLQEAGVRLQTMQSFDQKSVMADRESQTLQRKFDIRLAAYVSQFTPDPKRIFVRDRRSQ